MFKTVAAPKSPITRIKEMKTLLEKAENSYIDPLNLPLTCAALFNNSKLTVNTLSPTQYDQLKETLKAWLKYTPRPYPMPKGHSRKGYMLYFIAYSSSQSGFEPRLFLLNGFNRQHNEREWIILSHEFSEHTQKVKGGHNEEIITALTRLEAQEKEPLPDDNKGKSHFLEQPVTDTHPEKQEKSIASKSEEAHTEKTIVRLSGKELQSLSLTKTIVYLEALRKMPPSEENRNDITMVVTHAVTLIKIAAEDKMIYLTRNEIFYRKTDSRSFKEDLPLNGQLAAMVFPQLLEVLSPEQQTACLCLSFSYYPGLVLDQMATMKELSITPQSIPPFYHFISTLTDYIQCCESLPNAILPLIGTAIRNHMLLPRLSGKLIKLLDRLQQTDLPIHAFGTIPELLAAVSDTDQDTAKSFLRKLLDTLPAFPGYPFSGPYLESILDAIAQDSAFREEKLIFCSVLVQQIKVDDQFLERYIKLVKTSLPLDKKATTTILSFLDMTTTGRPEIIKREFQRLRDAIQTTSAATEITPALEGQSDVKKKKKKKKNENQHSFPLVSTLVSRLKTERNISVLNKHFNTLVSIVTLTNTKPDPAISFPQVFEPGHIDEKLSIFHLAVFTGHAPFVSYCLRLLDGKSEDTRLHYLNIPTLKDGYTALSLAAQQGHIRLIHELVIKGADLNQQDVLGGVPLFMFTAGIVHKGFKVSPEQMESTISFLLDYGALPGLHPFYASTLLLLMEIGRTGKSVSLPLIERLLKLGADPGEDIRHLPIDRTQDIKLHALFEKYGSRPHNPEKYKADVTYGPATVEKMIEMAETQTIFSALPTMTMQERKDYNKLTPEQKRSIHQISTEQSVREPEAYLQHLSLRQDRQSIANFLVRLLSPNAQNRDLAQKALNELRRLAKDYPNPKETQILFDLAGILAKTNDVPGLTFLADTVGLNFKQSMEKHPIKKAIKAGSQDAFRFFLSRGVSRNIIRTGDFDDEPLLLAATHNRPDMITDLLAVPEVRSDKQLIAHVLAYLLRTEKDNMILLFIDRKAAQHDTLVFQDACLFTLCAGFGCRRSVERLLALYDISTALAEEAKATALGGNKPDLADLIDHSLMYNIIATSTPAVAKRTIRAHEVQFGPAFGKLLKNSINRLIDGKTAFHLACETGDLELVKMLLERGADKNIQSEKGVGPAFLAGLKGHRHIVGFLLKS